MSIEDILNDAAKGMPTCEPKGLALELAKAVTRHLTGSDNPEATPRAIDQQVLFCEIANFMGWLAYTLPSGRSLALGEPVDPEYAGEIVNALTVACSMGAYHGGQKAVLDMLG